MRNIGLTILLSAISGIAMGQTQTDFIVIDQFGYLPDAEKVAIIRDPQNGFDAEESFSPGENYAVVDAESGEQVFSGSPKAWKDGQTDPSSGDKVWWFDFSTVSTSGSYYVLDVDNDVKSFEFDISPAVYNEVLKHAVRSFFYQRVGHEKAAQYAGSEWADGASHIGPLQDKNARLFSTPNDATSERDVSGGWYDAGDYNKYTNWTANYVVEMMKAYLEAPGAWGDDYNLPESGNGIPDLLDEAKWGIDHLLRLQNEDGGVLSIVDEDHASPPSSATGPSLYGPASTSATLNTAAALAISSKVFASIAMEEYANTLKQQAIAAWNWAKDNPEVLFRNNDPDYNSEGIGAGQQEENDYQRGMTKLEAACFLFDITTDDEYKNYFDANYSSAHMFEWNFVYPFESANQEVLLYYTNIPDATTSVVDDIKSVYTNGINTGSENLPAWTDAKDPYRAHIKDYTWGSNSVKCAQGNMFYNLIHFEFDPSKNETAKKAALGFINYMHGANPLNMTYLSNMYDHGSEHSVNEFYHTWFQHGSEKWDRVGASTYGPAPGFLTGGPNPSYNWDGCCPDDCGSSGNNAVCTSESIEPPKDQPDQKSYKDFNTSWPLNSWEVTENSCGYQVNYIKLLSKFVDASYDCNGVKNGSAFIDACGQCAGGKTGVEPVTDPSECTVTGEENNQPEGHSDISVFPNPNMGQVYIQSKKKRDLEVKLLGMDGKVLQQKNISGNTFLEIGDLAPGTYFLLINDQNLDMVRREKIIKVE